MIDATGGAPLVETLTQLDIDANADQRVVITGIGVVSPVGIGVGPFWDGISSGRSGIDTYTFIPNFRAYPSQIGGEVKDFDPRNYMDFKEARRMSRMSQFAVAAARMAFEDSRLSLDGIGDDVAVVMGVGSTAFPEIEQAMRMLIEKGGSKVSPFFIPSSLPNMPACQIAIQLGLRGSNSTIATACAASSQAIGDGAAMLLRGDAEVVFAGGAEAPICELTLAWILRDAGAVERLQRRSATCITSLRRWTRWVCGGRRRGGAGARNAGTRPPAWSHNICRIDRLRCVCRCLPCDSARSGRARRGACHASRLCVGRASRHSRSTTSTRTRPRRRRATRRKRWRSRPRWASTLRRWRYRPPSR